MKYFNQDFKTIVAHCTKSDYGIKENSYNLKK